MVNERTVKLKEEFLCAFRSTQQLNFYLQEFDAKLNYVVDIVIINDISESFYKVKLNLIKFLKEGI